MRGALTAALLAAACLAEDAPAGRSIEVRASLVQIRPDGSGASKRGVPSVVCAEGQEGKLFIGRNLPGGEPDLDAIRVEFTPRVLEDGSVEIKVVSLGTELGERPEAPPPAGAARPGLTFHSALPAEHLYSVAGAGSARRWLRIGQAIDGWTLVSYDAERRLLRLTRAGQSQTLALTKPSLTEPAPAGPRIERLRVLPGESAELVGRDGHRMVITARVLQEEPAER